MNGYQHSQKWWRADRLVVVAAAFFMLFGGLAMALPRAKVAGSVPRAAAEPVEPTVAPTVPPTVAPTVATTVAPTAPEPTTPATDAPVTSSAVSAYDQNSPSDQASGQWQPPSQTVATQEARSSSNSGASVETTTPPMTTTEDLLVGPSTTRAVPTTVAPRDVADSKVTRTGGSSDPKIWAVVAALGAVAVALGIATVAYWRRTRPMTDTDDDDGSGTRNRSGSRRRSRYADLVVTSPDPQ